MIETPSISLKNTQLQGNMSMESKPLSKVSLNIDKDTSRKWHTGIDTAKATMCVTTQKGIRILLRLLHHRYLTNNDNSNIVSIINQSSGRSRRIA